MKRRGRGVKWTPPPTPQEKLPSKSPASLGLRRISHEKNILYQDIFKDMIVIVYSA